MMKTQSALLFVGFALVGSIASAVVSPTGAGISYEGQILKPDGVTPVSGTSTQFKVQIRTPDAASCLLYEEVRTLDMSTSGGNFAFSINDGAGTRTDSTGYSLERIFANQGTLTVPTSNCVSGSGVYAPGASDSRVLSVSFKDETMTAFEQMPTEKVSFAPFAIEAKQIAGFGSDSLLRVVNGSGDPITGLAPLSNAQYNELLALSNGASTTYAKAQTGGGAIIAVANDPSTPAVGSIWYNTTTQTLMVHNSSSNVAVGGGGGGGITALTGDVSTTGSGSVAAAVNSVGGSTAANIHVAEQLANAATSANTASAIVKRDSAGSFNANVATVNGLALNNTGAVVNLVSPVGANYTLTLPGSAGSAGQVMQTNGTGTLSWVTPLTSATAFTNSGNSFGSTSTLGNNDNFDLNFRTNSTTRMTLTAAGNVGIGTTAPVSPLEVAGTAQLDSVLNFNNGVNGSQIGYMQSASPNMILGVTPTTGSLLFYTSSGGSAERMRISPTGNVGIGSTSPSYPLDISVSSSSPTGINVMNTASGTAARTIARFSNNSGYALTVGMTSPSYAGGSGLSASEGFVSATTTPLVLATGSTYPMRFVTGSSSAERMRIDTNGNVGIGTTSPGAMLDVNGPVKGLTLQTGYYTPATSCTAIGQIAASSTDARPMFCATNSLWTPLMTGQPSQTSAASIIDFSSASNVKSSLSCQAFSLYNLKDGQTYRLFITGTSGTSCSFTAYSDSGSTSLTVHAPSVMTATSAKTSLATITVMGTDAVVEFVSGMN